jgi:thiol-disulfide isomerase/thioredoxin
MDQEMDLKVDVPLYNPKAIFSDSYYSFLKLYFTYGYRSKNPEYGYILTKESDRINSSLKNEIRDYFITGTLSELFLNSLSEGEFKIIDSLYTLNDYKLSPEELEYISQRKNGYLEREKPGISLNPKDSAPDFEIKDVNGDFHKLSDLKGKKVYLHFWATWCGPCLSEIPTLNEFANKVEPEKIIIVNVCLDSELYKLKKIITEKKLAGLNLICDEKSFKQISKLYNISSIPHYALIDENGLIIKNHCNRPNDIYDYITLLDNDRGKP